MENNSQSAKLQEKLAKMGKSKSISVSVGRNIHTGNNASSQQTNYRQQQNNEYYQDNETPNSYQEQNHYQAYNNDGQNNMGGRDNYQSGYQNNYPQAQMANPYFNPHENDVISYGEWMWSMLVMYIPVVNIVFFIIWGITNANIPTNKKNWAIARFVESIIWTVLFILFFIMIG